MLSLSYLLLAPCVGAFAITFLPREAKWAIRSTALLASGITFAFSWAYITAFDLTQPGLQFVHHTEWNTKLGTSFTLGLDGFSYPMVLLATLLSLVALLASAVIKERVKGYYILVLLLESAMLGVFMAQDWSLFYVFWELTLIPLFFLIDRWGGKNRHGAALNFVLYTMGGSVFMLISLLILFDAVPGHTFSMTAMAESGRTLPQHTQVLIFLGFLIGFGVKMPIFPLHGWLPLAHVEAPSPISILLSGILLKMGSYGLIRAAGMLPDAVLALQGILATLAFVSIIYGGLLAWRHSDLKAMIAYSSISHMGVVLLGIAALNLAGLHGALMQMVAHGLVAGSLFLLIGLLYERTHTRNVMDYSSLIRVMPRFAFFTTFAFIAAASLPGTAGFVAELNVLIGGFARWSWIAALLTVGVLLSVAYAIRTIRQLFTGPVRPGMQNVEDLRPVELIAAGTLTAATLLLGFMPSPVLKLVNASATQLSNLFAL
ncbi:MAG: NADH-quinone oxidoreductase subunit M [Candidatus Thiodiazotropha sp. (ex Lucinoma aequizonata)]|nr:NADH-quinone oxidoreductase subunit M [Candidatus Thiodiazotropha sp. (ex Lucinoma aequizonata)]MCU7886988.1 NADH-quinone oxidoreductase subunit M [Candidatus Thiodiazotropha sp. (ex Lucinoma aequizonata)]MCU7895032.1 NADH-quinone oxidoreductase subunit M [Candidatus Thiodiazotropha sp. (ex Lucinoma aequizonata)]MCU7900292.1 NADH-quinone oxidoreductase subunit M [Candidatus Thiodiazotropha sp. (ex Lucinoma aequizonata)]MCU7902558.1 NADH-quinone oxidoreductase subunit M [Candidatus Thiodiazot